MFARLLVGCDLYESLVKSISVAVACEWFPLDLWLIYHGPAYSGRRISLRGGYFRRRRRDREIKENLLIFDAALLRSLISPVIFSKARPMHGYELFSIWTFVIADENRQ